MEAESKHQHLRQHHHVVCNRHPASPVTGFCATCLRERLSGMDPETHFEIPIARKLGRSRSLSVSFPTNSSSGVAEESYRRSCDVRSRSTLHDLLMGDDGKKKGFSSHSKFKGLGFDLGIEINENEVMRDDDKIRVPNEIEEYKTIKEFIDLERGESSRKQNSHYYSNVSKNLRDVASSVTKKISKWQSKNRNKSALNSKEKSERNMEEKTGIFGFRRSCDANPRFSLDSAPHRASWDGCLIENARRHSYSNHNTLPCLHKLSEEGETNWTPGRSKQRDDEMKALWNVKVSPNAVELLNARKLLVTEKELRDSNWYASANERIEATPIRVAQRNTKWWHKLRKGKEERSNIDNGFFRFYLTPLKTQSGRSKFM